MKFPVSLAAEYRGLDRQEGSFERDEDGVTVQYGRLHRFEVEQPDGTTDAFSIREKALDECPGGLNVGDLPKGTMVDLVGIVGAGRDGGLYFKPVSAARTKAVRAA